MSNKIKVSVIVPIYNVEDYLARCIESLLSQTLKEIEIILVNDGSPDKSQDIINHYAVQYPKKIIPLLKENGGLSDARNYGIPYAKGEFISFIDSDDYVDETFLEKMYKRAKETKSEIVVCGYYGVDESKGTYRWLQKGNLDVYNFSAIENPSMIHYNAPYAWNKIYHRSLFEKYDMNFPKGWIWEDIPIIYPLLALANKVSKVDQPLIYYVLKREGSITATVSPKMLQIFQSLELLNKRYKDHNLLDSLYDELLLLNMRHIIFRFKEFTTYRNFSLKMQFVKQGFKHLNNCFPGWKKDPYYFTYYDIGKPFKQKRMVSKWYWYYVIFVPNFVHNFFGSVSKFFKKIKNGLSKKNLVKYIYAHYWKHSALDENAALFESFHGTTISDSPFYMMKECAESRKHLKLYFTTEAYEKHKQLIKQYSFNVKLVDINSFQYAKLLATSKYLVNNVSFPPYFIRRQEQKYMNTWHGTPLKTLGKNMVNGIEDMSNMQRNFIHASHMLHPNDFTMAHMMEDYNLFELYTGKVIVSGYPRNSIFLDTKKAKEVRQRFNLENKEVFAYMPTWRGTQSNVAVNNVYARDVIRILDKIDESLSDNQVFYVNLHSLVKDAIPIEGYRHILPFPNVDNYEFLNCVDVLISDYSSVFFDFSLTNKPIVLFMYDYEDYMNDRGMYFDVRSLPFEKIYTLDDMTKYLSKPNKKLEETETLKNYREQFIQFDSIDCSTRVNDYFFDDKDSHLNIYDYSFNKDIVHTLYFPQKVVDRKTCDSLKEVHDLNNPIIIFMKNQFNYLLREKLIAEYNDKVSFIVVKHSIAYTFFERVIIAISRYLPFIKTSNLQCKAFNNLLSDIQFNKIVYRENPSKFTKKIVKAYYQKNNTKANEEK